MEKLYSTNSKDWSMDIQPDIDVLYNLDGEPYFLSDADLEVAEREDCRRFSSSNSNVSRIICNASSSNPSVTQWEKAKAIEGLRSCLSKNNPIHELLKMEREIIGNSEVDAAYEIIGRILIKVKDHLLGNPSLSPKDRMLEVFRIMKENGIKFRPVHHSILARALQEGGLDCDGASITAYGISNEFNWPVTAKMSTEHVFLCWLNGDTVLFNIDAGRIRTDAEYIDQFSISDQAIQSGAYFTPLTRQQVRGILYLSIGNALIGLGNYEAAKARLSEALILNPKDIMSYVSRGVAEVRMGQYDEGIEDLKKALKIDPTDGQAMTNLGAAYSEKKEYDNAIMWLNRALEKNARNMGARYNRGIALENAGQHAAAFIDLLIVFISNPKDSNVLKDILRLLCNP